MGSHQERSQCRSQKKNECIYIYTLYWTGQMAPIYYRYSRLFVWVYPEAKLYILYIASYVCVCVCVCVLLCPFGIRDRRKWHRRSNPVRVCLWVWTTREREIDEHDRRRAVWHVRRTRYKIFSSVQVHVYCIPYLPIPIFVYLRYASMYAHIIFSTPIADCNREIYSRKKGTKRRGFFARWNLACTYPRMYLTQTHTHTDTHTDTDTDTHTDTDTQTHRHRHT